MARGEIKTALLAVEAMFSQESWKDLYLAGHLEADTLKERIDVLGELYAECYKIPQHIYAKPASDAVDGLKFPSFKIVES